LDGLNRARVEKRLAQIEPDQLGGGGAGTVAGGGDPQANRILTAILKKMPADLRPSGDDGAWSSQDMTDWLQNNIRNTPLDAVATVSYVSAGRRYANLQVAPLGSIESDGVRYELRWDLSASRSTSASTRSNSPRSAAAPRPRRTSVERDRSAPH
jgi:hypothetical protein